MDIMQSEDYWTQVSQVMVDKVIKASDDTEYQLLEELGRGSYGCLFLGQSLVDTTTYVAIKVLSKAGLDPQQQDLQQLEIDIQSSLKHDNVLTLHGTAQDQEFTYMIMELCDGGDLFDFCAARSVDESTARVLFSQILDAVDHLHANFVYHRDLKLENVLLINDAKLDCRVADFGLATRERYNMEFGCGSTAYLAPEHFDDGEEELAYYDAAASDVWSLGILLLALLVGRNPWQEATSFDNAYRAFHDDPGVLKHTLFPSLSSHCFHFLTRVLSPDPAQRPSITEMKHQFAALDRLLLEEGQEDDDDDDYCCWPVDITPIAACTSDKASFDSAVFSMGNSWSDMVEEDEQLQQHQADSLASSMHEAFDDEDDEMFIHSQEKSSWWL
ncbi:kinase-like domain-containing protein [Syncephalastrum racemosum]|uniref:Kinase-like domain-containing protein n=1 Tax=Syncephalastrum racemosum TaxID=13706 RepID=A0A1X2H6F5_SYNRA|nr:kinase-like domain-containing protein [Syncephalastrum racemosum]